MLTRSTGWWKRSAVLVFVAALGGATCASDGLPNVPFKTLGGKQVWADVAWHAGWRVQENALTGHYRLLDPGDVRRAWGSERACRAAFERRARSNDARRDHLVVLLHGLGRSRGSFGRMERELAAEGYAVASVSYASTRRSVAQHADRIVTLLDGIEGPQHVSFVTHSLGGLVAREVLSRDAAWMRRMDVGRLVMIAPPSRGSALAEHVTGWPLVREVFGPSAHDATPSGARAIAAPPCPFGIVAAGSADGEGWCPLVPGDDDGVVGVEEARLAGARDFLRVEGLHTFLPGDDAVIAATREFLAQGRFPR